jgi:aspartate/methionine/tyrosine aminotransferase
MDSGMFLPMQLAAADALGNPETWYEQINSVYSKRRHHAEKIMKTLNCTFDNAQTGLFLWGKLPGDHVSCENFSDDLLLGTGVFITPGFIFGKNGQGYIRISLCSSEAMLGKAGQRVSRFVSEKN